MHFTPWNGIELVSFVVATTYANDLHSHHGCKWTIRVKSRSFQKEILDSFERVEDDDMRAHCCQVHDVA